MKKILLAFVSLIITLTYSNWAVIAEENVNVVLDGKTITFDVPAQIINERTMVPVRKIFEELGMAVEWYDETQTIIATRRGVIVKFPIGSTTVYRNTVEQNIDVPAQLVGERTLVPIRFVSEFAGAEVIWDENTNTVYINSTDNIKQLPWNDTYIYWGETKNGLASGYGALYTKEDGILSQLGKYIDSQIVIGTDYFDNGDMFVGNYEKGKYSYGTYYYSDGERFTGEYKNGEMSNGTYYYDSGDTYTGSFMNGKRHGSGTYYYKNGSYHEVTWENDLPNGYGVFYEAVEDVQYEGNYKNGKRDGDFLIKDFYLNKTYYATYDNGIYVNEEYIQAQNKKEYEEEHAALIAWAEEKMDEIYAEGDKIYNQILNKVDTSMKYDSNLDSYAIANAMRQQAVLIEQYKKTAEIQKAKYIAEQLESLAKFVQQQENELKNKYNIK